MAITRWNYETKEMETYAAGRVLKVWVDSSYRIMSDIWGSAMMAEWWDGTRIKVDVVWVADGAISREDKANTAEVDATPEVKAEVFSYTVEREFEARKWQAEQNAKKIEKGAIVQVARGKHDKFKVGKVVYSKSMEYRSAPWKSTPEMKHCIALDEEKHMVQGKYGKSFESHKNVIWVWDRNLERMDIKPVNEDDIRNEAKFAVMRSHPDWVP